jgi:hypothetical protein
MRTISRTIWCLPAQLQRGAPWASLGLSAEGQARSMTGVPPNQSGVRYATPSTVDWRVPCTAIGTPSTCRGSEVSSAYPHEMRLCSCASPRTPPGSTHGGPVSGPSTISRVSCPVADLPIPAVHIYYCPLVGVLLVVLLTYYCGSTYLHHTSSSFVTVSPRQPPNLPPSTF